MALVQAVGFTNEQTSSTVNVTIASTGSGGASGAILILGNYIDTKHVTSLVIGAATSSTADFSYSDTNDNFFFQYFSIPSISSGITTATVHMSASGFLAGVIIEESGLAAFDKSSSNYQTGATSWTSNNTATTSQASEIAYGMAFVPAVVAGSSYGTLASGWTVLSGTGITAGVVSESTAGQSYLFARKVLSSTGAYSFSATSATNDTYGALIGTYETGSSGSSITPSTGAAALAGNAPSMNLGIAPLTARKAWDYTKGLLVPSRKIFLPPRPALYWEG